MFITSISIALLIVFVLVTALLLPKTYIVKRSILIRSSKKEVFDYLRMLKNHDSFTKWARLDPEMKKVYKGIDGTVGFQSAWESTNKNVGKGEQEIKRITEGQSIDYEIRFLKPFKATSTAIISTERMTGAETKVEWTFNGSMSYPMNLMLLVMNMDKMLGPDLEIGLKNLKGILEK